MMFLLDEHISPEVSTICAQQGYEIAVPLRDWKKGAFLGQSDEKLLAEAAREGMILVTFDLATIPVLLQQMAMQGEPHAGVILISTKSYAQNDAPDIARALIHLAKDDTGSAWANRVVFLSKKYSTSPDPSP